MGKSRKQKQNKDKAGWFKPLWFLTRVVLILFVIGIAAIAGINRHVVRVGESRLVDADEVSGDYQCIIVLGASVYPNGTPSPMLKDRLDKAIELYEAGAAPKILVSGDNGQVEYNEVEAMKNYLVDAGVDAEDIFMDHAGFSTYETMYRARDVFNVERAIIVTQRYHEYRALYIATGLGLGVTGVSAEDIDYTGQFMRDAREVLARVKDFVYCIFKPEPTFLGDPFDITGDGRYTWSDADAALAEAEKEAAEAIEEAEANAESESD